MKFFKIIFLIIVFSAGLDLRSQHKYQAGDALPSFRAFDINGKALSPFSKGNKYVLLLFCDPANAHDKFVLSYAQVVYKKYRSCGLEIIGVSRTNKDQTKIPANMYDWQFPFIIDNDKKIHDLFGINDCCGGTVLAHFQKGVQFSSNTLLSEENLRQIIEKAVIGKIHYQFQIPDEQSAFRLGEIFPSLELYDFQKHVLTNLTEFASQDLIVNCFASFCDNCQAGKRMRTLQELNKILTSKGWHPRIMIIFQKPFDQNDVAEIQRRLAIPYEVYLGDNILPEDQKYITDNKFKNDPFTVVVRKGKVVYVEKIGGDESEVIEKITNTVNAQEGRRHE